VDKGRKGSGEVMRWDMGGGEGGEGGEGGNRGGCCGVPGDGGWKMNVCVMGRDDGCLLSDGEGVKSGIVFTFLLVVLVGWGVGGF